MKKLLTALIFMMVSFTAMAELTFDQVQTLIAQKNYNAAKEGLNVIVQNHPNSAKVFYAISQTETGLGNLQLAQKALDKAKSLDPELKFAPSSNVERLQVALTPQTDNIQAIDNSHMILFTFLIILLAVGGWFLYQRLKKSNNEYDVDDSPFFQYNPTTSSRPTTSRSTTSRSTRNVTPAYTPASNTVHNHYHDNGTDMLTGVMIGSMMSDHNNNHGHDTTVIVNNNTNSSGQNNVDKSWDDTTSSSSSSSVSSRQEDSIPATSSSWDSTPSSKSSSWDSTPSSSSKSSSWDSTPSSSKSSSWDSGSSSSSSSWSSSYDSSASSSSSSWD